MPTLGATITDLARRFEAAGVPSPRVDAELLVAHVLGLDRAGLLLGRDRDVAPVALDRLEELARRREAREPLQHLLGEVEWGDLMVRVTPAALVPRPETEVLLHLVLDWLRHVPSPRVLDVGTGTGILALGVKHDRPDADVSATDLSPDALALARQNADRLGLDVRFVPGDLNAELHGPFDLVVSNPPYLPDGDALEVEPEVGHDPTLALYVGPDGLDVARRLIDVAAAILVSGGALALELDPRNVGVLAGEMQGWETRIVPDLAGRPRFLLATIVAAS